MDESLPLTPNQTSQNSASDFGVTTEYLLQITGISNHALKGLMRKKEPRGILFQPDFPRVKQGSHQIFSARDLFAISRYVELRAEIEALERECIRVLKEKT